MAGWTQAAGAVVSLALIAGVGVWSYKLIMRDVTGIPIVQAMEGPMRVAPADPGGDQADHQGLAVNEVAGRGAASGPAEQLVLAPTPVDLADEDAPAAEVQLARADPASPETAPTVPLSRPVGDEAVSRKTLPEPSLQDAAIQALADQIAAGVKPLTEVAPVAAQPVGTAQDTALATALPTPEAAATPRARSLRPQIRPAALRTASVTPASLPADTSAALDLDAASLPAGTRLVQLGAYDSAEVAQREWARIADRFDNFFDGKRRVIQEAQSGGRTFYRLRAEGFTDLADARRFCAALVAERADCIPVVTR